MKNHIKISAYILFVFIFCSCAYLSDQNDKTNRNEKQLVAVTELKDSLEKDTIRSKYLKHITWQSTQDVTYDPSYFVLNYPKKLK